MLDMMLVIVWLLCNGVHMFQASNSCHISDTNSIMLKHYAEPAFARIIKGAVTGWHQGKEMDLTMQRMW